MLKLSTGDQIEVFYIKDNFSSSGRPPIQYWVKKIFLGQNLLKIIFLQISHLGLILQKNYKNNKKCHQKIQKKASIQFFDILHPFAHFGPFCQKN